MGLNRLAHTMLSVLSHNLIHGGLQRDLQRRIKPHDLTTEQALRAYVEKHLPEPDFRHILDNNGVRDDIRDILIEQHVKIFKTWWDTVQKKTVKPSVRSATLSSVD